MKKFLVVLCALTMMLSLCACGSKDELVMATNAEFPPYEYHEGEAIVGIDVEIAQAIANEMGRELVIEDMAFDSIIMAVTTGKADMGVAGLTITEDRLESVSFSIPYTTAAQVIIVKDGSDIASPDDLVGRTVGVQLGTTGDIYASDYEAEGSTIERYNKGADAIQSLKQGKVDCVIIDNEPAKLLVEQNANDIKMIDIALTTEQYAYGVDKAQPELLGQYPQINRSVYCVI